MIAAPTLWRSGAALRPGDVVRLDGSPVLLLELEPYSGPLATLNGGARLARVLPGRPVLIENMGRYAQYMEG